MAIRRALFPFLGLLAAALACGPVGAPSPVTPAAPQSVETVVAATLTALAPPAEGDTPVPPLAPTPSAAEVTPTPAPVRRLVYTSGGKAWVLEGSDPPRQITHTGGVQTVVISDDGLRIVYLRRASGDAAAELRAVGGDGANDVSLLTPEQVDSLHPRQGFLRIEPSMFDFIPGTHDVLFNTRALAEGPGALKFNDLYRLDADSGEMSLVLPGEEGGDFSVSPDGSQIALVQPDSISMANIDGSGLRSDLVTFEPVLTYSEYQYYPDVVWATDSSAVGVVIPSREPLGTNPSSSVWRIPAHSGSAVRLSTLEGESFFFSMGPHSLLAPDLARVAFTRETTTQNVYQFILAAADGSDPVVVDTGRFFWHGWAPDAAHFIYGSELPSMLQLGRVGGSHTPAGEGTDVGWLNASEYVFLGGSPGDWELRKAAIGGAATTLVTSTAESFSYDFTP